MIFKDQRNKEGHERRVGLVDEGIDLGLEKNIYCRLKGVKRSKLNVDSDT